MINTTKFQRIALLLMLLVVASGGGYVLYQDATARQALAENTEYQALTALEAQRPEIYVIAVQEVESAILIYIIVPDNTSTERVDNLLADMVTTVYDFYPDASTYHILFTNIVTAEVFEGEVHLGVPYAGFGFTNYGVSLVKSRGASVLEQLFLEGEWGAYNPDYFGIPSVSTPTARARGHIPPWTEVE